MLPPPAPSHGEFLLPLSCSSRTATSHLLAGNHSPLLLNNRTPVLLQMAASPAKRQHFQPPLHLYCDCITSF